MTFTPDLDFPPVVSALAGGTPLLRWGGGSRPAGGTPLLRWREDRGMFPCTPCFCSPWLATRPSQHHMPPSRPSLSPLPLPPRSWSRTGAPSAPAWWPWRAGRRRARWGCSWGARSGGRTCWPSPSAAACWSRARGLAWACLQTRVGGAGVAAHSRLALALAPMPCRTPSSQCAAAWHPRRAAPPPPLPTAVILLLEHEDGEGSSGLILNMPTPLLINNLGLEEDIAGEGAASASASAARATDRAIAGTWGAVHGRAVQAWEAAGSGGCMGQTGRARR